MVRNDLVKYYHYFIVHMYFHYIYHFYDNDYLYY